jgi:Na+/proline symporter
MQLTTPDWVIMALYFALSLAIGLMVVGRAGKNFKSFFLSGQNMSWWLLGISLVATTFSTDTPNLVTDIVRKNGVFGNWAWWAFLLTGMLTVFLYAKLWRRSGINTDVEFYEIRYSGKAAAFLRGFRGVYLGVVFNTFIMASVTLAAIKIGGVMFNWTPLQSVVIAAGVTLLYSTFGGLLSVLLTDLFQFIIAMIGSISAAFFVLGMPEVNGLGNLLAHPNVAGKLDFLPNFGTMTWEQIVPIFIIPIAVQWWATYYPGSEPGGGGYVVQRMLSARNEKHAVAATLLFQALHYALRPWPWIIVALASLLVFPDVSDIATRFPHLDPQIVKDDLAYPAMMSFLPPGLIGLVVTSLAAAYMSTMATQVNYGSSIIVNDVYQRFINPQATDKQLVMMGRISTVVLMVVSCALSLVLENAKQAFDLILLIGAGTGLIYLLRWFWWRINAETEIVAMVVSFVVALVLQFVVKDAMSEGMKLLLSVGVTTLAWVVTAFVTKPTDPAQLLHFYERIRPSGPGWQHIAAQSTATAAPGSGDISAGLLAALCGVMSIYGVLFTTGFLLYGALGKGLVCLAIAVGGLFGLVRLWPRLSFA